MPAHVMVQGACPKWVITTCKQISLCSVYLLLCPTEEFYTQLKTQFSCELKRFSKKKKKNNQKII